MEGKLNRMKFSEFQKLIRDLYYERDRRRGLEATMLWLIEEIGELVRAIRKGEGNIDEEIADCIAWIISVANLLNIDVEKAILKKYPMKCSKCNSNPCRCKE